MRRSIYQTLSSKKNKSSLLFLDDIAYTPVVAYSLNKIRSAYNGACLEVKCAGVTQDIGFTPGGLVDTIAIANLSTSNGNAIVTVSKWYDQGGSGNHAITNTAQPQLPVIYDNGITRVKGTAVSIRTNSAFLTVPSAALATINTAASYHSLYRSGDDIGVTNGANHGIGNGTRQGFHTPFSDNAAYTGFFTSSRQTYAGFGTSNNLVNIVGRTGTTADLYRNNVSKGSKPMPFFNGFTVSSSVFASIFPDTDTVSTKSNISELVIWQGFINDATILKCYQHSVAKYGIPA